MRGPGLLIIACLFAIPAGIGVFTFVYAKGFSYLSTDPRACANCHIMNDQYAAWLKSGHRHVASCVECHLPHGGIEKWIAKADHGFRHSMAFTLQNFREPIEITPRDRRLVQVNCVRCHVEYYFKGPGKVVTYPWAKGLRVEEIEAYYDAEGFSDWTHAETGNKVLKAQHPEFEVWSQGVHARAGVACADCHMPYQRVGALKVSDHWVRSPLLNVNRACQPCHAVPEAELMGRVLAIQDRHHTLLQRAATATTEMLDAIVAARKAGVPPADLERAAALHRKAQWRLDFVAAENSMGFRAPQEMGRILGEAIDFARHGQLQADQAQRRR